ncbi:hypothetical protein [Streptomyces violascens]|uniref:Uncharacterized protein n=1 Tax=Streptomyces violascens TaxID=67381 RepID=A0ABQ3QRG0_9ACTN|nr:hypothetical protein [Streptomyces violascens]GGU48733.1 hypothetical protein GCM10010289_81550 [Streptomyces violascens]GHI39844.1 hypothetical protein Sviol_42520 [Streptomyces violascens]
MTEQDYDDSEGSQELILDIGLSWMASKSQYPLWLSTADYDRFVPRTGPVDTQIAIVNRAITESNRTSGMQIGEDVRRVLASPLTDEAIRTVWLGTTQAYFDPAEHRLTGRDWMHQIEQTWTRSVRRIDAAFIPSPPHPVTDAPLRRAVLKQIRSVAGDLELAASKGSVPGLVPALEQVVNEACADLGYRLFLRAMKAYFVEISEERCEVFIALGQLFSYPEFLVDDNLNVRDS